MESILGIPQRDLIVHFPFAQPPAFPSMSRLPHPLPLSTSLGMTASEKSRTRHGFVGVPRRDVIVSIISASLGSL